MIRSQDGRALMMSCQKQESSTGDELQNLISIQDTFHIEEARNLKLKKRLCAPFYKQNKTKFETELEAQAALNLTENTRTCAVNPISLAVDYIFYRPVQ